MEQTHTLGEVIALAWPVGRQHAAQVTCSYQILNTQAMLYLFRSLELRKPQSSVCAWPQVAQIGASTGKRESKLDSHILCGFMTLATPTY